MDESVPPGVVLRCRLVGVIEAEQRKPKGKPERNDRFLLVATTSHRYRQCNKLSDISPDVLDEIERFFEFPRFRCACRQPFEP